MISFEAFIDELSHLHAVTEGQLKAASDVTQEQAETALKRLAYLDAGAPTAGQLSRSAAVGAIATPLASNISRLISHGEFSRPRDIAGQIAGGLVMGTAMPLAKHKMETSAERRVLRDYINQGRHGRLTHQIESKLNP